MLRWLLRWVRQRSMWLPVHGPQRSRSMAVSVQAGPGPHCAALPDPLCRGLQGLGLCTDDQSCLHARPLVIRLYHAQVFLSLHHWYLAWLFCPCSHNSCPVHQANNLCSMLGKITKYPTIGIHAKEQFDLLRNCYGAAVCPLVAVRMPCQSLIDPARLTCTLASVGALGRTEHLIARPAKVTRKFRCSTAHPPGSLGWFAN